MKRNPAAVQLSPIQPEIAKAERNGWNLYPYASSPSKSVPDLIVAISPDGIRASISSLFARRPSQSPSPPPRPPRLRALANTPAQGNIFRRRYPSVRMPNCGHCDAFVTEQYIRVFAPGGMDTVRVCPDCEDVIRDGSDVRKTR